MTTSAEITPERHDWREYEPTTVGGTSVWVCRGCRLYRFEKPSPYDLQTCPTPLREANRAE